MSIQRLAGGLHTFPGVATPELQPRGGRSAAVLALLSDEADPEFLFTRRSFRLRNHPGQVSFPGGRIEPGETPPAAAMREAEEEIGLAPGDVRLLGELPASHLSVSRFDVHTVVATWPPGGALGEFDPDEVASVHRVPASELVDPANRGTFVLSSGIVGPVFEVDGVFIWGMTAILTDILLTLGGWTQPWDQQRVLPIPDGFARRPPA